MFKSWNDKQKLQFKIDLKLHGLQLTAERLDAALSAMQTAQESANSDEKSTAGDKHETTRAMSHLENEMNAKQMEEARHDLSFLHTIDVSKIYSKPAIGSVVVCSHATFFIAAGLGAQTVDDRKIIFISPKAPLTIYFLKEKGQEHFKFNGIDFNIMDVF